MFSFYGTKWKLAGMYSVPKYSTIVEPFAGAAGYSCLYPDKDVVLCDLDPKIVAVWEWLIAASPNDVRALPDIAAGDSVRDFGLSLAEEWLIGFCINPGSSCPKVTATPRSKWAAHRDRIAQMVPKIKHWTVRQGSYDSLPDLDATWFVDPPYQVAGKYYYGHKNLDFKRLGSWCRSRKGQVIVCENTGANWLPFRHLTQHRGSMKSNTEVVWERDN